MSKSTIRHEEHVEFLVKSQSDCGKSYKVQFGDFHTMPSCSCFDWQKHHWPCKHFLAIYKHFPGWGWERMSPSYTLSPYFTIDSLVIPSDSLPPSHITSKSTCSSENVLSVNRELHTVPDEVDEPENKFEDQDIKPTINPKHEGRCCREILKEVQNLTYLCPDGNALVKLKQDLHTVMANFKNIYHRKTVF